MARDVGMVLAGKWTQMKQFCKLLRGEITVSFSIQAKLVDALVTLLLGCDLRKQVVD